MPQESPATSLLRKKSLNSPNAEPGKNSSDKKAASTSPKGEGTAGNPKPPPPPALADKGEGWHPALWGLIGGIGVALAAVIIALVIPRGEKAPVLDAKQEEGPVHQAIGQEDARPVVAADREGVLAGKDNRISNIAHRLPDEEVARMSFRSTVLLVMEDSTGQPVSFGSGFFVRDRDIATNVHVVAGAARGYAKLVGQKAKFAIEGVTAVDAERDLVLLRISEIGAPALVIGRSDVLQVGESVYAVGNPRGLEGTFSKGNISSIRELGTDKLLQITAPISPGSSGGPVLNGKAEVIGVSVATFKDGQNLNFAIPSTYLKALLGKAGPLRPLAQVIPSRAQRSILADLGGKSSEGVIGTNFSWTFPGNRTDFGT
jgi:S1-C subfamily serine protease